MISLSRIVFVNWYTFGMQDIDVRGSIGLVGPNGAGKSSILDAIQVIITGNNKNHLSLNASSNQNAGPRKADEKRSVRDYCLGKIQNDQLRPESITYLALVFEREHDKRCWTIGLGLSAREQDSSEDILCAFIAPGQSLRAEDFVARGPDGPYPLDHEDLLVKLKRVPGFENHGNRPTNFTKHVLDALRGKHYKAEPKRFLSSIKSALRFKEMESANQFVRNYLLDDDKIDIEALRTSVATWRGFQEKIEQLEEQRGVVLDVINEYRSLIDSALEQKSMRWVERKAERDRLERHLSNLNKQLEAKRQELSQLEAILASTRNRRQATADEIADISRSLATNDLELAIKDFKIQLEGARKAEAEAQRHRDAYLLLLGSSTSILSQMVQTYDKGQYIEAKTAFEAIVSRMDASEKLTSREVDLAVQNAMAPAEAYQGELNKAFRNEAARTHQFQASLNEARDQLRDVIAGKALIRHQTQSLIDQLAARDIEATPVSTLVEVLDEEWRDAVETILGPAREALIVDPQDARDATSFMRQNRADFVGCQIVNTTRTREIDPEPRNDSLAAILSTDNPHVRAFLNRRLNNVVRVKTEDELLKVDRGITPDCIAASGGTIEVRRPVQQHLLGKDAQALNRPLLEQRIAELELDIDRANRREENLQTLVTALREFTAGVQKAEGLFPLENALSDASRRTLDLEDNIRRLESDRPVEVRERLDDLQADLEQLKEEEAEDERKVRVAQHELGKIDNQITDTETGAQIKTEAARAAFDMVDDISDDERASHQRDFDALLEGFENLPSLREAARTQGAAAAGRVARLTGSAPVKASTYARDYDVPGWEPELGQDHPAALEWLKESLALIDNHHLTQYREQVETARVTMEETVRSDLLLKLYSRIDGAKAQIRNLSNQLRTRIFHRERYEFTVKPNPAYHDIVQVAKRIRENPADVSTLFSPDAELDGEIARGVDKIRAMLESGEDVSEISDYRNYLRFDLITRRIEDDEIASEYSKRQGTGSGGEKQVPFYIAISCAVANTCHHKETDRDKLGLGFVMFDEAFNKLDGANTSACLSLMSEFNLQAIVSAPFEKQLAFMEHMDTIITVNRVDTYTQIDVEYPTDAGRALFRDSNPGNVPLEEFLSQNQDEQQDNLINAAE
ncbi:SbcC/MukB-like Walker B domain-containing protein [Erythrobacter aureus]|uniref:SMC hinge domain-containing protein n=1 Tax=Erythrobacter aureus TaxID=2182384 RepID=A0A345YJC8_9SPHN|nr:SbcC/MukB-like Walker B domain-containing protein [Erythrobacter aureus]AXK44030.1 hypothetical protein DVR09_16385 [Erythrobacter aureus]